MGTGEVRRGSLTRTEVLGAVGLGAAVGLAVAVGLVAQARGAAGAAAGKEQRADPRPSREGEGPARSELEALRARVMACSDVELLRDVTVDLASAADEAAVDAIVARVPTPGAPAS